MGRRETGTSITFTFRRQNSLVIGRLVGVLYTVYSRSKHDTDVLRSIGVSVHVALVFRPGEIFTGETVAAPIMYVPYIPTLKDSGVELALLVLPNSNRWR